MTNMNTVTIESAEQKDYASWLPLWINYQTFYRTKISDEVTKLTWERFLTPNEPVYCAVAKYDGKIVGLVHYLFHRSTWAESNYCYLEDLFVSEEVRGQHIGKQLIEYVQQQAKKHHASRLYWHTHETNLRGQRLYDWVAQKSGMIEYRM
ncbi:MULTISPECIES: GNAT family N-acetyltransferase [Citrobacter]|uniref:GNAT family N-acetyltransferase n=1 Tax=Citrobacter TaxID=544 RepID=UPI0015EA13FE|nr:MULTISPECIES: GNAT family N-acetyltransferase [Citrobacter]MBJ8797926.1 GNAT family N-acetyltransferase [Citrobacter freundii]MBJ8832015.1 GNAT family N-acetyltransferase [Citrobacter freundii]MBJ9322913.1 GNAT family N-acetyltransferase [Citrobacter freundii]MBK2673631.1 GNAT family N-acetyltransferase [Citrobacter freundii]MCQ9457945.1 GNAT family N-acetyltransferase [Citrobacter portucalensis]